MFFRKIIPALAGLSLAAAGKSYLSSYLQNHQLTLVHSPGIR